MQRVLINDGIHPTGLRMLQDAGYEVTNEHIAQDDLFKHLPKYSALCVRSATKVRKGLIDMCPGLKVIGRGGVGLDNIDVEHAISKGIKVINTPAASSRSVAELAMGHAFTLSRFVHQANRDMPSRGGDQFKALKKSYAKGIELQGKTMGIIGAGRIGREMAQLALGVGMKVIIHDQSGAKVDLACPVDDQVIHISKPISPKSELLKNSDFISLHVPYSGAAVLTQEDFDQMKNGVFLINAARGGVVDEDALLNALDSGKVAAAGIDVFEKEPNPRQDLLSHPRVSLTPHIGASTAEAQEKIGVELAEQIIALLG